MAILKWQKGPNEWVQLYGSALRNRLRRDKNLGDLENRTEAKKNLGLFGNVDDHHHDSRYLPMIERIESKVDAESTERKTNEKNIADELRARAEAAVSAAIESFGVSISQEASKRQEDVSKLKKEIAQNRLDLGKDISQETNSRIDDKQELITRIDTERSDRTLSLEKEVSDRNSAVEETKKLVRQEETNRKNAITQEAVDRDAAIERKGAEIEGWINAESANRDLAIAKLKGELLSAINSESDIRTANKADFDKQFEEIRKSIEERYRDALAYTSNGMRTYYVGEQPPESPVDGKTIWFNTTSGKEEIRLFKNDRWILFGAGYL